MTMGTAIRRLYTGCPAPPMGTGKRLSHGKSFRDEVSSSEVDTRHQAVLSRLRTETRARHYSLRTEQAYVHWIRRFVTFRSLKLPTELVLHHSKFDGRYRHRVQSGQPIHMEDDQHAQEKISRDAQCRGT